MTITITKFPLAMRDTTTNNKVISQLYLTQTIKEEDWQYLKILGVNHRARHCKVILYLQDIMRLRNSATSQKMMKRMSRARMKVILKHVVERSEEGSMAKLTRE